MKDSKSPFCLVSNTLSVLTCLAQRWSYIVPGYTHSLLFLQQDFSNLDKK